MFILEISSRPAAGRPCGARPCMKGGVGLASTGLPVFGKNTVKGFGVGTEVFFLKCCDNSARKSRTIVKNKLLVFGLRILTSHTLCACVRVCLCVRLSDGRGISILPNLVNFHQTFCACLRLNKSIILQEFINFLTVCQLEPK